MMLDLEVLDGRSLALRQIWNLTTCCPHQDCVMGTLMFQDYLLTWRSLIKEALNLVFTFHQSPDSDLRLACPPVSRALYFPSTF